MNSIVLLFVISSLAALGGKLLSKLCSDNVVGGSTSAYTLFLTVNGLVACFFFWLFGGFRIALNRATLIYSIVYAIVITFILIFGLLIYKLATIAGVNIISAGFSLLGSMLIGYLLFDETIDLRTALRVLVMLIASILVFFDLREHDPSKDERIKPSRKKRLLTVGVFAGSILSGYANVIVTKAFSRSPNVTDENSFFFMTNAWIVLGALVVIAVTLAQNRKALIPSLSLLKPKKLFSLAGNTFCSNVGSLIYLRLITLMDVSLYTPISSAVGMVLAVVSSWLFRERLGILSYLATALACVAFIL